jgi:hypothetical protein
LPRQCQQRRNRVTVLRIGDEQIVFGILKHCPELVANQIGGNLATTHRSANKRAGEVLGVIQHELVAGFGRNGRESGKRIDAVSGAVTG